MRLHRLKRLFVGAPIPTAQSRHERLGKAAGLAIFASDPLSSNAYATEEILHVLILAGAVALSYSLPVAVAIAALILIVISSYRQTIRAYPGGGGAYIVAKDNLGTFPSLVAGAALLTDYVLTVAVSVAAGVAAATSAIPELFPYRVIICVAVVIAISLANLRGVRESGQVFAIPTYFFVVSILGMVVYGLGSATFGRLPAQPYEPHPPGLEETDPERTHRLEKRWGRWGLGIPLIVLTSPCRSLLGPLLEHIDKLQQKGGENDVVTIVLPEFIPARWWQQLLHNQTALLIKGALLFHKNVVVTDVPYHLKH